MLLKIILLLMTGLILISCSQKNNENKDKKSNIIYIPDNKNVIIKSGNKTYINIGKKVYGPNF